MNTISGVYKITNTITGDFYIGSSKDVKHRWKEHKKPSRWKKQPNSPMYQDMQKYGVDKFAFEILEEVEVEQLKEMEQQFIEKLHPTYNKLRAFTGLGAKKGKEAEYEKKRYQKYKEERKQAHKKYSNKLCSYNGETLTLDALRKRFGRQGIQYPVLEAKKYLI